MPGTIRKLRFLLALFLAVPMKTANGDADTNSTTIPDDWGFDRPQDATVLAYLPKPFALLSMVCSYAMIRELAFDQFVMKKGGPISRMLISVAVADVLFSLAWAMGTWAAPSDAPEEVGLVGNVGTQATCTMEGFLMTLGMLASQLSNAALSVYCLLVVRHAWRDRDLVKVEKAVQGTVWLVALASAVYPIFLDLYYIGTSICYVESNPPGCSDNCIRGSDPTYHQLYQSVFPILCLLTSTSIMIRLVLTVRRQENKTNRYRFPSSAITSLGDLEEQANNSSIGSFGMASIRSGLGLDQPEVNRKKSTAVARQGMYYATAFLASYLFPIISMLTFLATGKANQDFDFIAWCICYPSTGTFNFLVFCRLREHMRTPEGRVLRATLCCCCQKNQTSWIPTGFQSTAAFQVHAPPAATLPGSNTTTINPLPEIGANAMVVSNDLSFSNDSDHDLLPAEALLILGKTNPKEPQCAVGHA